MFKRDLRINYQTIYDVLKSVKSYKLALGNMESAVDSIEQIIRQGKGQVVEKLVGKSDKFKSQIKDVKEELDDLSSILDRYIKEMTAIISPVQRNQLMQVDRNDIYWNMQDIIGACRSVSVIPMTVGTYGLPGGFTLDDSEEETARKERNYENLAELKRKLTNSYKDFELLIGKLNNLYKIVQEYENKDDHFRDEASGLTDKYTDFWEGLARFFSTAGNAIKDFVVGLLVSVKDLVVGLLTFGKGLICYIGSAVVIDVAQRAFIEPPKWATDYVNKANNMIVNIVRDPSVIVEGMAQGISDTWEEKGASYCIGYATGFVLSAVAADKGLSKASKAIKAAKASKAGKVASSIDDIIGTGARGAEELAGAGISSTDDLVRIGVSSVDDLERLGLTSAEELSKLGISSVDDLVRLGINSADDLERLGLTSTEALEKVGITDASQLVEKGIVSEKELAEIGIGTVRETIITPEMESKILEGQRVSNSNRIIGGHSPKINNANPSFATETISVNADGTSKIKYVKQFADGKISKIKTSTIFPNNWSDNKIINAIKEVGSGKPIGYRARDGASFYRGTMDGVQIEVIKIGDKVTSGYPTGGGIEGLPSGFSTY